MKQELLRLDFIAICFVNYDLDLSFKIPNTISLNFNIGITKISYSMTVLVLSEEVSDRSILDNIDVNLVVLLIERVRTVKPDAACRVDVLV
jgi:hypothetical protein